MSYTFRAGDLPKLDLDVDRGSDFLAWEKQWNSYMILSGLADSAAPIKVHALHCCLSRDTHLGLTEAQRGDQEQIVAALKSYVQGRVNETVERRNFRQRKQALGESFDDYLLSLRELANTCNFCDNNCLRSNIRDQLVTGLIDPDTIKDLLREPNLTLTKAIDTGRALEAAKKELHSRSGAMSLAVVVPPKSSTLDSPSSDSVYTVSRYQRGMKGKERPASTQPLGTCNGCGKAVHLEGRRKACPAYRAVCSNCGKLGHYSTVCRQKPSNQFTSGFRKAPRALSIQSEGPQQTEENNAHHPGMMSLNHSVPAPTLPVHIQGLNGEAVVEVLPDSGADISAAGI